MKVLLFLLAIVSVKVLADSSFSMNGYTLRIIDTGSGLVESDYDDHIHVFLDYFPRLHDDYDPTNTSKDITFQFDPNYKGVAQAERDHTTNVLSIRWDPSWVKNHPIDPATVMHEVGHLTFWTVRNGVYYSDQYPNAPGWLNEGIASYMSWQYTGNLPNGGGLQTYDGHDWTVGYGYTANFLKYIEENKKPGFIKALFFICKKGQYKDDQTWIQLTGKTLQQNWNDYLNSPASRPKRSVDHEVHAEYKSENRANRLGDNHKINHGQKRVFGKGISVQGH